MNDCTSLTRFSKFDEASHTFIPGIEIIVDIVRAFQCSCGTVNYAIHVDLDLYIELELLSIILLFNISSTLYLIHVQKVIFVESVSAGHLNNLLSVVQFRIGPQS